MELEFTATLAPRGEKKYPEISSAYDTVPDPVLFREEYQSLKENMLYARFIQTRLFRDSEIVSRKAGDYFILDIPRDIVSGDFGWFYETGDHLLLVVGDCTGHGVSAALLSMVMKNFLNQCVFGKGIKNPALILSEINNYLFRLNKNCEQPSLAGLDIGICSIYKKEKIIRYCGANRPLYIMRSGGLIIVKDSRHMMGSDYAEEWMFRENVLPYIENDMLYMFSDGFCDQFGGIYNKKLMNKRLKGLLVNMQGKPMPEQKKMLEDFFNLWKAGMEQTDDVYITGLLL